MAATVAAYLVPGAQGFPAPDLARIIFFHLPCAFIASGFFIYAAINAALFLKTGKWEWECKSIAANEIAAAAAIATMITGIIFSKVQWQAWWNWDPRQTSFLIVLLLQGAYFAIRMAYDDEQVRARMSAGYSTMTVLPIIFLIFVYPNLPQVKNNSLHPTNVVAGGGFDRTYYSIVLTIFALLLWYVIWLFRMHVRTGLLEKLVRDQDGQLETYRGSTAAHRVGDPLSVHEKG